MNAEDAEIIRTVRREFGRRPVDATRLDIQVVSGRVTLAGILCTLRDQPGINLKDEVELLMKMLQRDRMIKEVSNNARLIQPEKAHEEEHSRGRSRH